MSDEAEGALVSERNAERLWSTAEKLTTDDASYTDVVDLARRASRSHVRVLDRRRQRLAERLADTDRELTEARARYTKRFGPERVKQFTAEEADEKNG